MSSARFGDSQLRQAGKGLLLPLLQPLHALRIFQLPVGPTPFQQLADGIGQLSLTESRKIGDDLAHQIQFAGGEHAPAERNGLFQMFRSPTAAADAATSRVGHPEEKVQRNLTRLLYGANGQSPGAGGSACPTKECPHEWRHGSLERLRYGRFAGATRSGERRVGKERFVSVRLSL